MIATVTHVTRDDTGAKWGATAIYPRGLKPERLELYSIGYAGDGCEMTGLQVVDEFGTMSGPVILVPETEVGLAYDGALTHAFDRDDGLAIGSGWPPIVIGFDPGPSANRLKYAAGDLAGLFREPAGSTTWQNGAGAGYGTLGLGRSTVPNVEAFVLSIDAADDRPTQRVAVVLTTLNAGPRDLRRIAHSAHEAIGGSRRLAVAISVGEPTVYDPKSATRRALDTMPPTGVDAAALSAVAAAVDSLTRTGGRS